MEREPSKSIKQLDHESAPQPDEIRVDEHGNKWKFVDTGYTVREYFSHSTEEKGPGPGWDYRKKLLNKEWAMRRLGKTFSEKEVFNPGQLPDDPFYDWERVE